MCRVLEILSSINHLAEFKSHKIRTLLSHWRGGLWYFSYHRRTGGSERYGICSTEGHQIAWYITVYIDKWDYTARGGNDYLVEIYVKRPSPRYSEMLLLKQKVPAADQRGVEYQHEWQSWFWRYTVFPALTITALQRTLPIYSILKLRRSFLQSSDYEQANNNIVMGCG